MVLPLFPLREDDDRLRNLRVLITRNKINVDKLINAVIFIGNETNKFSDDLKEIRKSIDIIDYKINKSLAIFKITLDNLAEEECYERNMSQEIQSFRFKLTRMERKFNNFRKNSLILFFISTIVIIIRFFIIMSKL